MSVATCNSCLSRFASAFETQHDPTMPSPLKVKRSLFVQSVNNRHLLHLHIEDESVNQRELFHMPAAVATAPSSLIAPPSSPQRRPNMASSPSGASLRSAASSTGPSQSPLGTNSAPAVATPSNTPKLRRKAPIADTLDESTAVQRLVEYFVVVSSHPRWEKGRAMGVPPPPPASPRSPPISPEVAVEDGHSSHKSPMAASSKKKSQRQGKKEEAESRQESDPPVASQAVNNDNNKTHGNIHMPENAADYTFEPKITARFPPTDYTDNPLNPMILQFCYPGSDTIVPSSTYELPRVHHFVLTNDRGRKLYGTCLTIFEEYLPEADGPWKSQATVTMQNDQEEGEAGIEVIVDQRDTTLYIPKVLCLLSTWPYLTAFREYLAQLYRLASTTNVMTTPIERYVVNMCLEIPAPPPGAYEVQVRILDSTIRFWAPPAKLPIAYVALPYQTLFECLDMENILTVWSAMAVERKILLVSSQYSILTVCSEILCSLLFPMRWSHLYVPLLPRMLCPILDAPVPYLCGIVRENWIHAEQFVSEDTIIVDLDRNSVIFGPDAPEIPSMPPKKFMKLQTTLNDTAGSVFWKSRGLAKEYDTMMHRKPHKRSLEPLRKMHNNGGQWVEKLATMDHAFNLAYTPDSANLSGESLADQEQSQWDRVQECFVRFFVALLKRYRSFLDVPLPAGAGSLSERPSFNRVAFVAAQKDEVVPFLSEMCMTQSFDDFITRRMYSPGEPDLIFFDQSIDAKINRSRMKIKKVDTPFLHSAKVHKVLKKLAAVEPNPTGLTGYDFERRQKPYMYRIWPETFDESLFCPPRSIPKMIAAEFDRQAILVSRLRANVVEDEEEDMLEFYGGDYDPLPEVASFTVFFFAYSALVGREWREYAKKRRDEIAIPSAPDQPTDDGRETREGVNGESGEGKGEPGSICREAASVDVGEMSMEFCGACPEASYATLKSTMQYVEEGAGEAYKSMFPERVDPVKDFHRQLSATQDDTNLTSPQECNALDEYEEAREVANAQLDLAFEALAAMDLRGLSADSDVYKSLMEACGRCGDTQRALKLMELMKKDGFVTDSEVLACFVAAFAHDNVGGTEVSPSSVASGSASASPLSTEPDAYSCYLQKRLEAVQDDKDRKLWDDSGFHSPAGETLSDATSGDDSKVSRTQNKGNSTFLDWFSRQPQSKKKKKKGRRKRRKHKVSVPLHEGALLTDMLARQMTLGESLLDFLYPDLAIDCSSDSCPQCSYILTESNIVDGWLPCAFQDYTTRCSGCHHRFVPRFVVTCASPTFEGSQGSQTPLYCEFLSPWVLRKELQKVIKGEVGIVGMLRPEWRSGTDIRATLYWNMMVLCRRYKLPFSFLLQGNFSNRLVLPRKPTEV